MADLTEQQKRFIEILNSKGIKLICPRCGNNNFSILEGYVNLPMAEKVGEIILGGRTLPTIVTYCTKCGFLSQHLAGVLGLFPKPEPEEVKKDG